MASKVVIANPPSTSLTMGIVTDIPQPYRYIWKRNGKPIGGAGSDASLTINNASPEDLKASYSCLIYGVKGHSEESAAVSGSSYVAPPPPVVPPAVLPPGYAEAILALMKKGTV